MMSCAVRVAVLVLLSAAVGLGYARLQGLPLWPDLQELEKQRSAHERWLAETAIELDEFAEHYELGGLVIDARPREEFEEGHLDAPLIMSMPADEAADGLHLERALDYQGEQIVLYCASATCDSAEILWRALQGWGFSDEVRVYHPGWEGIVQAGLPTVAGPEPCQDQPGDPYAEEYGDEFDQQADPGQSGGD